MPATTAQARFEAADRAERRAFLAWNRLRPGVDDEATLARFEATLRRKQVEKLAAQEALWHDQRTFGY